MAKGKEIEVVVSPEDEAESWSPKEVSRLTGISEGSLAVDRCLGRGFPWYRIGRRVRYRKLDVLRHIASNMRRSTQQASEAVIENGAIHTA